MRIENIRYLIEVSKYKSINKASKQLYVNQQQLSRIIAAAEDELQTIIFERTAKGVSLTPEGREVIKKFENIVEAYDSICPQCQMTSRELLHGKLKIMSDANIWTGYAGLYNAFMKAYPHINCYTESMSSHKIVNYLLEHNGIGQISRVIKNEREDFVIPFELQYKVVAKQRAEVYGWHSNPHLCKWKTVSLETLLEMPFVNYKPYGSDEPSLLERIFHSVGTPNIRYEVSNYRVFQEIVKETDCLFLAMRKPSYISENEYKGIPLRDKIYLENGIVKNKQLRTNLDDTFEQFYLEYYDKLYETES